MLKNTTSFHLFVWLKTNEWNDVVSFIFEIKNLCSIRIEPVLLCLNVRVFATELMDFTLDWRTELVILSSTTSSPNPKFPNHKIRSSTRTTNRARFSSISSLRSSILTFPSSIVTWWVRVVRIRLWIRWVFVVSQSNAAVVEELGFTHQKRRKIQEELSLDAQRFEM